MIFSIQNKTAAGKSLAAVFVFSIIYFTLPQPAKVLE